MIPFLLGVLGLCVGSFLNVVILNENPSQKKLPLSRRSACPHCHAVLQAIDLVPLVSFLMLRGSCRNCRKPISWHYPAVEAVTMFAFLAVGIHNKWIIDLVLLQNLVVATACIVLFVVDVRFLLLPDRITLPVIIVVLLIGVATGNTPSLWLFAAGLGGLWFCLQHVVSRGAWVGSGDIRLGILMGLVLGFPKILIALLFAYISGAIFGSILLARKKANGKTPLAFGPFLIIGLIIAFVFGDRLLQWYVSILFA